MKRIAKLLLAVLVLCGACDAVGLGGASDNGTGGGGNVNLVGTTWRGTYQGITDDGYYFGETFTFSFTSRTGGSGTTEISGNPNPAEKEFIFEYSISGVRITIIMHTEEDAETLTGNIFDNAFGDNAIILNIRGKTVHFIKA